MRPGGAAFRGGDVAVKDQQRLLLLDADRPGLIHVARVVGPAQLEQRVRRCAGKAHRGQVLVPTLVHRSKALGVLEGHRIGARGAGHQRQTAH